MSQRNRERRERNQREKKVVELTQVPPSDAVVTMLSTAANPLVAISLIGADVSVMGYSVSRFMGCIVERLDNKLRLVLTCRHAFEHFAHEGYRLTAAMKNPRPSPLQVIGQPIEDPEPESDIAFLVVRDNLDAPTEPLVIGQSDPQIKDLQMLYNAQNRCDPLAHHYEVYVARQPTRERAERGFCKNSEREMETVPARDLKRQALLQEKGWVSCRMLQMYSRPGFSGSPVWDEQRRLYGIDVRGTQEGLKIHDAFGDVLVCLPASELYAARQRVGPALNRLLGSL